MAKFEAEITANVNGFISDLNKAEKKSIEFGKSTTKSLDSTSAGFNKLSRSTGQANSTAMEFTRIIQDAPYGMIGIGNNIQQLTANFGQLKNSAGSTGAALKQTFSSLLSSGNLLSLGVAAITSAWAFYTMSKQKANKANEESIDIMKQMIEGLNEQSKVLYDAANSTGKEVAQLNTLYSISQDVTASTTQRTNAANKLIKQYPDLLGNFTAEEVLLGKSNEAYKRLSSSILETARAQAAYGKISEKAAQQIAIDETNKSLQKEIDLLRSAQKADELKAASIRKSIKANTKNADVLARTADALDKNNIASRKIESIQSERDKNLLERAKLQEGILDLEKIAVSNQLKSLDVTEASKIATEGQAKATKDYGLELNSILAGFGDYDAKLTLIVAKYKEINEVASKAGATVSQKLLIKQKQEIEELLLALGQVTGVSAKDKDFKKGFSAGAIAIPITLNTEPLDKKYKKMNSDLKEKAEAAGKSWSEGFDSIVNDGIVNMSYNLGDAIGNAIGSGSNVLNAAKGALLGTLGGIMSEVGHMTIKLGVAMLGIKKLLMNPFSSPYAAIAAGVALVAIGAAFSAGSKSIASGGSGSSGYNQSAGSGTVIRNDMGTGRLYNNDKQVVELKLKNTELVGAMNLNSNRNNRLS